MRKRSTALLVASIAVVSSAHVGSPNVVFDGNAGPYAVRVIVRPPMVVPGRAEVIVQASDSTIQHVVIRPVFWRAGVAGAPEGDEAARVATARGTYSGQLWLMAYGAYSVYVTVSGTRGSGTATVPVMSFATGRLGFSRGLAAILIVLAGVLVVGIVTLVYSAVSESTLTPGEAPSASRQKRARIAGAIAVPTLALLLFGGAKWWESVDTDYQRTMFRPPVPSVRIDAEKGGNVLELSTRDSNSSVTLSSLIPDHEKIMHLFLVSDDGARTFAHLHPVQLDSTNFRATLPALPAGGYRLFADVTTENGTNLTLTTTTTLPAPALQTAPGDTDDAWTVTPSVPAIAPASAPLENGYTLAWIGDAAGLTSDRATDLRFEVRDPKGAVVNVQPYLGMAAHAVVMRDDGSVFIHLHPMGTISTATQAVFALRDRGDTTRSGGLDRNAVVAAERMAAMPMSGAFSIPYEFPKPGRYHIWVQVKPHGRVQTGTFDVVVK